MRRTTLLFVLAITAVSFISCSRAGTGSRTVATEMRYGFTSEPATLDPLAPSNTADGRSILFNVFEGLVRPDIQGRLPLWLAESVSIEDAGRVYKFTLRKNVLFHDGSPLTVADVRFTMETVAAAGFPGFSEIEKIETSGDYDIQITLKSPDPDFLPYLTLGVVKAGSTDRDKNAIGTGPYSIESYTVQQSLVLKKFDNYWQSGVPRLDKVTIAFLADSDALILGLYGGSLDGASLTGNLIEQIDTNRFDIIPGYSAMVQMLALNNAAGPLRDIRVRQAINYGIDIQNIIDMAFFGQGEPSGSPLIPGLAVYYEQSLADPYPVNQEKARALLGEAGYGENGQRLSLEITVPSNFTMHVDTAQVIANQLEKIGINVTIRLVDWATWLSDVYFGRNYQATIISVDSPYVSPKGFLARYQSQDGNNFFNFVSADFDRIYNIILNELDENERIALYKEAQLVISNNATCVFIQDILGFTALRGGAYSGVLSYPLSAIDFASMYGK